MGGTWAFCPTVDVVFYVLPALILIHWPTTLWLAAALSAATPQQTSPTTATGADQTSLTTAALEWVLANMRLALTGFLLALANFLATKRIAGELGWLAALACPGVTWRFPVAVASLAIAHYRHFSSGALRRGGNKLRSS